MEYKYGVEYRTPSGMPKIPADTIVQVKKSKDAEWSDAKYAGGFAWAAVHSFRIVDERCKSENWYERGELPPVGTECLCWFDDGRECWHECFVIGSIDSEIKNGYLAVSLVGKHERKLVWANEFRPLRTDREKFIEAAVDAVPELDGVRTVAGRLFDAGFKAPEAAK